MADVNTGSSGTLQINATVSGSDAAGNWSDVTWSAYLIERVSAGSTFSLSGNTANVVVNGATVWSGTFGFDWRPAGLQSNLIASGTTRVYHNADGTPPATSVTLNMGSTGTSGAGGPTSVSQGVSLATLKVTPGTPTGVAATRISDTSTTVAWSQSSATNGQPTSNTIRQKVNGGAWADVVTIFPAVSANLSCAANQKIIYGVKATNSAGDSAWSADSAAFFTTPAAPTAVVATKVGADIVLTWADNVAFSEHSHVITHGVDVAGTITWDGSPLATIASGTATYTHVTPNPAQRHVYKIKAKNTGTAALESADVQSNVVVLLTAPNAPTLPTIGPKVDKASAFVVGWTHNSIDTTAQTAYEFSYSTNGGTSWSTTGKVISSTPSKTIAANTYAANVALTIRVRTWGGATSGGSDGTGASPWSDVQTVTFKTRPVATITVPATGGVYAQATLAVQLGFSQAESATFVSATIELYSGATLLESVETTTLASTVLATRVVNGSSYSVKAIVRDSNGIASSQVTSSFTVTYTAPVAAVVTVTYLPDSGIGQIGLTIPGAGGGLAAAVAVTITRTIDGVTEDVVVGYPSASSLTILDTTPTIHGDNLYTVTTISADGAKTDVTATMTTAEDEWAFMSKGAGFSEIVRFGGELKPQATPTVDALLVKAAGRSRPIGLYATTGGLTVSGTGEIVTGLGSSAEEIEAFLLVTGKGCYRDPTGRRMFGMISGQVSRDTYMLGSFTYTVTETS